MPTFPRTIKPHKHSIPQFGPPLVSIGHSGKPNIRSLGQLARSWSEEFAFKVDENGREFLAQINNWWRNGTELDVAHQSYTTTLGVGTGTPKVKGGSQTGATIDTDGWTASQTGILKAGDLVTFSGLNTVYEITADCDSDGSGNATLPINPSVLSGSSPADNADIAVTASVVFKVYLVDVSVPPHGPFEWVTVSVTFRENPS